MAIFRIYPEKDTFITNVQKNAVQMTGSNFGASEILEIFKKRGISGSLTVTATASLARTLLQFDLSGIAALTASGRAPSTGSTYVLRMTNAIHVDTVPTSFDLDIIPLSQSWTEGVGIDHEEYLDKGEANWDKATRAILWTTTGSDFLTTSINTASFVTGNEDIEVDVTNIVGAWLTGGLPNNGFLLKLTDAEETDSINYFRKKFHGRETNFLDKRPSIEMRWDDSLKDDRDNLAFDASNTLFLYNKSKGTLANIAGIGTSGEVLTVTIQDPSGSFIQQISGSHTGLTGIYSASFTFTSASYSGSRFNDVWHSSSVSYLTGTFTPFKDGPFEENKQEQHVVSVKNLKKEYELNEDIRFNLFVRTRSYNPAVVLTGSLKMGNTVITKGYYRVDNALTEKNVIPLGTGTLETTRLSYDKNGNYFKFFMSSLSQREVYNLVFFFEIDGQLQKVNQDFRFRVI